MRGAIVGCSKRARERVGPFLRGASKNNSQGFTLLELMVAFAIFSLMVGVLFSGFRTGLNSYSKSQERLETGARQRVLQDQIRRQLGSTFPVRPSGSFLEGQEDLGQGESSLAFSRVPLFYGTSESVTFATVAPLMLHRNPGLTVVRYGLAQDEAGNHYLGALEGRYTGLQSFMTMVEVPPGIPLALIEPVVDLRIEYYGYDAQTESYGWFDSWDGEEMQAVPRAVRLHYDGSYINVPINANFMGRQLRSGLQQFLGRNR